jgi:hypothetical protein
MARNLNSRFVSLERPRTALMDRLALMDSRHPIALLTPLNTLPLIMDMLHLMDNPAHVYRLALIDMYQLAIMDNLDVVDPLAPPGPSGFHGPSSSLAHSSAHRSSHPSTSLYLPTGPAPPGLHPGLGRFWECTACGQLEGRCDHTSQRLIGSGSRPMSSLYQGGSRASAHLSSHGGAGSRSRAQWSTRGPSRPAYQGVSRSQVYPCSCGSPRAYELDTRGSRRGGSGGMSRSRRSEVPHRRSYGSPGTARRYGDNRHDGLYGGGRSGYGPSGGY